MEALPWLPKWPYAKKKNLFLKGKESQGIPQCLVPEPYMGVLVGGGCGMLSAAVSMERAVVPPESTFGGSGDKDAWFGLNPAISPMLFMFLGSFIKSQMMFAFI